MHLDFAVVADYALVDQSGKMSVLGIFQHIWVPQFPAMHPRLHLVLRLKGRRTEIGEHRVQIKLLGQVRKYVAAGVESGHNEIEPYVVVVSGVHG